MAAVRIAASLLTAAAVALVVLMLATAPAHADGDPASDVLLGQNVFYPYGPAPVSASLQKALNAETVAAGRRHFPIKIALIQSPLDLGAVPNLFDKPQLYADFLDQEISFQGRQPLLVVMPDGYGVQGLSSSTAAAAASLAKPTGGQTSDLARAAITAVQALAAVAGHEIEPSEKSSTAGTGPGSTTLVLFVAALAAIAAATVPVALRRRGSPLPLPAGPSRRGVRPAPRRSSRAFEIVTYGLPGAVAHHRRAVVQPRLVVGGVLIFAGAVWAGARGLQFYGMNLADLAYDLDQPPLLLLLVGGWLVYRSRGR